MNHFPAHTNIFAFSIHGDATSSGASNEGFRVPDENDDIDLAPLVKLAEAEQGDVEAQNTLGECYYYGRGLLNEEHIPRDMKKAFFYWSMAANQGNANAQRRLGEYYWPEGEHCDKKTSFCWYKKAADQGDPEALFCLARFYLDNIMVDRNKDEAIKLYQESANRGYAPARKCLEDLKSNRNDE